ncbi:MAG TPA: 30S ribosomal protein S6 [Mycoplasmatales bacterium]|jgi:ribosomal protein S6|nr:30S ribosomal protein S6 [Mycoplasmatales bacterium]
MNKIGKQNEYEILFITRIDEKEEFQNQNFKNKLIEISNLQNLKINLWKEGKLAYKIANIKETENAAYFLVNFNCENTEVGKIRDHFNSIEKIKRFKILNISKDSKKMEIGRVPISKPRVRKFFKKSDKREIDPKISNKIDIT